MTNMIKIDMDIASDFYNSAAYNHDLDKYNVGDKLIELEGPAGANAYVWLKGTPNALNDLLEAWGFAAIEIEDIMNDCAKPA